MLKKLKNLLRTEIDPAFAKRAEFIFREVEKYRPKIILDVGCGRGFYLKVISLYTFPQEIHGIDINKTYLEKAIKICSDQRIKIKQGSIYKLPYRDNYFDFIICSEVLEHLSDDKKALLETKRVLKPSGFILITVPNYNFPFLWDPLNWILMRFFNTHINKNIWWLAGIWADHERLYTQEEIIRKTQGRFTIEKVELLTNWCWPFAHFILYGVGKNLVEKLNLSQFNRFSFKRKPLSSLLAKLLALPSNFMDKKLPNRNSVNIVILGKKADGSMSYQ